MSEHWSCSRHVGPHRDGPEAQLVVGQQVTREGKQQGVLTTGDRAVSLILRLVIVALVLYAGAYVAFRQTHTEIWDRDRQAYVIFPESYGRPLYYLWRPLSSVETALTGMRHHIGPHR